MTRNEAAPSSGEKTYGIQNKWLLIISLALGAIVVLIYNVHIQKVREEAKEEKIAVAVIRRAVKKGERITAKHLRQEMVPVKLETIQQNLVRWDNRSNILTGEQGGRKAVRDLQEGKHLLWSDVGLGPKRHRTVASMLKDNECIIGVRLDRDQCPGDALEPTDLVSLTAAVSAGGKTSIETVLEGVQIVNLGLKGADTGKATATSYDMMSIIVSRTYHKDIQEIEKMLPDGFGVVVLPANASFDTFDLKTRKRLEDIKNMLATGRRAS